MAQDTVILNPGESKVVSFMTVPNAAGSYQVQVDGLTGQFLASEVSPEKPLSVSVMVGCSLFTDLGAECYRLDREDWLELGTSQVRSLILSHLRDPKCIYYAHNGHGSEDRFWWGNWETVGLRASDIHSVMYSYFSPRPPITFAVLLSCDSLTNSENPNGKPRPGTFAYELTKGGQPNSAVVGYSGLDRITEDWIYEAVGDHKSWTFDYLTRGYPVYKSYMLARQKAVVAYPGYEAYHIWRFIGDKSDSFRLIPQQEFPEEQ